MMATELGRARITFHGETRQENFRHVEKREHRVENFVFLGFLAKWVDAQ